MYLFRFYKIYLIYVFLSLLICSFIFLLKISELTFLRFDIDTRVEHSIHIAIKLRLLFIMLSRVLDNTSPNFIFEFLLVVHVTEHILRMKLFIGSFRECSCLSWSECILSAILSVDALFKTTSNGLLQ